MDVAKNVILDRLVMYMVTNYEFPRSEAESFVRGKYSITKNLADVKEEVYNFCCDYD